MRDTRHVVIAGGEIALVPADASETDIASGKLPQGAALLGERAMTDLYRVSIGTVRRPSWKSASEGS